MLVWNEAIHQSTMANSVYWYCVGLRMEGGHDVRRMLEFEVEGQRKKGKLKRT